MSISNEDICKNPVPYINQIKAVQKQRRLESERKEEEKAKQLGVMVLTRCMEAAKLGNEFFELPIPLTADQFKILEERFFVCLKYRVHAPSLTSHRYEFSFTAPE